MQYKAVNQLDTLFNMRYRCIHLELFDSTKEIMRNFGSFRNAFAKNIIRMENLSI